MQEQQDLSTAKPPLQPLLFYLHFLLYDSAVPSSVPIWIWPRELLGHQVIGRCEAVKGLN